MLIRPVPNDCWCEPNNETVSNACIGFDWDAARFVPESHLLHTDVWLTISCYRLDQMQHLPCHLLISLEPEPKASQRLAETCGPGCNDAFVQAVQSAKAIDLLPVRRVRFSDNEDDSVNIQVFEVERITDPCEMALVYANRDEIEIGKNNARRSTVKAAIDYYDMLQEMKVIFLGPRGNANRKLNILLDWNLSNDEHRGLESHLYRKWVAEGEELFEDWGCAVEWSAFLALVDCMTVYGPSKAVQDIARIFSSGQSEQPLLGSA